MTSVLVVSDIRLYREGIAEFLRRDGRLEVAGAADGPGACLAEAARSQPDVALVDLALAGAEELMRDLSGRDENLRVVALTVPETEGDVVACAAAGATAYVTRESSLDELVCAIEGAMRGEASASPQMTAALLRRVGAVAAHDDEPADDVPLTLRQRQIGVMLSEGLSNKEIASSLCIEVTTVKNHVHQILEKLRVRRRSEVAGALRRSRSVARSG